MEVLDVEVNTMWYVQASGMVLVIIITGDALGIVEPAQAAESARLSTFHAWEYRL